MGSLGIILHRNIHRLLFTAVAISLLVATPQAQPSPAANAADRIALHQALLDLTNPWTVMCIAGHPDDEDGTSLVVMRRKYGAHTVSLFSTFGEGGQNAIGPELYEEMGAIRARETMAASAIQGSAPYFLGLTDFGFSKSADETFQKWGHEEALRRMVLQLRKLRPDVIITNHSVTSNDHGHHQATARLVVEAFDAAADAKRFPEQLKDGVEVWQVQRLFVRVRGSQPPPADAQLVTIDPNERDPVRGTMFAEQALAALQKHATQGPWPKTFAEFTARFRAFSGQSGETGQIPPVRYRLTREAKGAGALPRDSRNFLAGLELPAADALIKAPTIAGQPLKDSAGSREQITQSLDGEWKRLTTHLSNMISGSERASDRAGLYYGRLYSAILSANQVSAKLVGPDVLIPGQTAKFSLVVSNDGVLPIQLHKKEDAEHEDVTEGIFLPCCDDIGGVETIAPGTSRTIRVSYVVPADTKITVPNSAHLYDGSPLGTHVLASVALKIGQSFDFAVAASKLLSVAPPLEIADVNPSPVVVRKPQVGVSSAGADIVPTTPPKVTVKLVNHLNRPFKGELAFGQENKSPESRRKIEIPSQEAITLTVTVPVREYNRQASGLADNLWFSLRNTGLHENLIKRKVPLIWVDARTNRRVNVGYVRGFDYSLPNALTALGVESKELSVNEVKTADLSKYTSIIVDNRVYESQPELIAANQKLLDFANAGGTLIVFYHKSDEWNPDPKRSRPQLAPYKLIVGNERITDENAPISFLEPDHPLLNSPNKMGQEDFVAWIQERGVNYPREWDAQFRALLQSNDPGEAPLKGGLLVADYGKGKYIYSSMVWYRQLRAGLPGAYRMLANMISYGQGK